ncbi:MAG: sulfotransferase [Pseudomonadota bacterium]
MLKLFLLSCTRFFRFWRLCWTGTATLPRRGVKRIGLVLAWPLFIMLQLLHWLGFALDEVLFRSYRNVKVRPPLFVVGPPRSGTTHLHHVLSQDPETTTLATWECLFALSVTARKLVLVCCAMDRAIGRPLARLIAWLEQRMLGSMDDVHPFSLTAPEEDFLVFMPLGQCFILVVLFPTAESLWRIARLDTDCSDDEQALWVDWYRRCVRKHLYVHGDDRTFLSKNASFSGSVQCLLRAFPEASLLVCSRDPINTVPSQLSTILPGFCAAGFDSLDPQFQKRLIELLKHYYLHLAAIEQQCGASMAFLDNADLRHRLHASLAEAMSKLKRTLSSDFVERLQQADQLSRGSSSSHRYSLADFGLTEQAIHDQFAEVYARYQFDQPGVVLR